MTPIRLPPDTRLAIFNIPAANGAPAWAVMAAVGIAPEPNALPKARTTAAVLSQDRGGGFPDTKSIAFAEAVLAEGGAVTFCFAWSDAAQAWAKHLCEAAARALAAPDTCQGGFADGYEAGSPQ